MRFSQTVFSACDRRWPVSCYPRLSLFLNQNLKNNTNMKLVKYVVESSEFAVKLYLLIGLTDKECRDKWMRLRVNHIVQ